MLKMKKRDKMEEIVFVTHNPGKIEFAKKEFDFGRS